MALGMALALLHWHSPSLACGTRRGNVLPGTVVESGIVSNGGFDFWLNSHAGLQVRRMLPRCGGAL